MNKIKSNLLQLKVLLITFALLTIPSVGYSDWTKIGTDQSGNVTVYVDLDSVEKVGSRGYFWELRDLKKPTSYGNLSQIMDWEVDCAEQLKLLPMTGKLYEGPMATGTLMDTIDVPRGGWIMPDENSILLKLAEMVCKHSEE